MHDRLEDFFSLEEVDTAYFLEAPKRGQMMIINGTFSWEVDGEDRESSVVLRDINLAVEPRELFAVVGRFAHVVLAGLSVCLRSVFTVCVSGGVTEWEAASRRFAPRCSAS